MTRFLPSSSPLPNPNPRTTATTMPIAALMEMPWRRFVNVRIVKELKGARPNT